MGNTGYVWDSLYTMHQMGFLHPESPRRLVTIKEVLDGDGVGRELIKLSPRNATIDEIASIHSREYLKRLADTAGKEHVDLDPDTSTNPHSWAAAQLAAGGCIVCAEAVMNAACRNAFALVRPPGHHALHDCAMGFCLINNIAITAKWLMHEKGVERLAIVDFDVHHGNGTQDAFYADPSVFFTSIHRMPFYPGSGSEEERGEGEGRGTNLNIPLEGGATDDDYRRALEEVALKAVEKFKPQFVLVSAGFDAHVRDPLGGMNVTTKGFRQMMRAILEVAEEVSSGRVVAVLEGGYDVKALAESVEVQLEEMTGVK